MVRSTALDAVCRGAHEAEAVSLAYTELRGVHPVTPLRTMCIAQLRLAAGSRWEHIPSEPLRRGATRSLSHRAISTAISRDAPSQFKNRETNLKVARWS